MSRYLAITCSRCAIFSRAAGGVPVTLWLKEGGKPAAQAYAARRPCPGCRSLTREVEELELTAEEVSVAAKAIPTPNYP